MAAKAAGTKATLFELTLATGATGCVVLITPDAGGPTINLPFDKKGKDTENLAPGDYEIAWVITGPNKASMKLAITDVVSGKPVRPTIEDANKSTDQTWPDSSAFTIK
jgi:hypothetical protein